MGGPVFVCRSWGTPGAMRRLFQVIASVWDPARLRESIKCHPQQSPEFSQHQSDAYLEKAGRQSNRRAGGVEQQGVITSDLWPARPAALHLLVTCLWRFSHLELFGSHQTHQPCTWLLYHKYWCAPACIFTTYPHQQPCILLFYELSIANCKKKKSAMGIWE